MSKEFWGQVRRALTFSGRDPHVLDPNAVFIQRVLKVFADARVHDDLLWSVDERGLVSFMADVSDTFEWGAADGEPILPRDLGELERAYADLKALETTADGVFYATSCTRYTAMLYAARRRAMRPRARAYPAQSAIVALLDACGGARG